jgi:hypothetical protein
MSERCPLCAKSGHTSITCSLPVDKPSATSSPLIAASGDAHLGAVSPDALLVSGPGELMSEHAPSRQGSLRQPGFSHAV